MLLDVSCVKGVFLRCGGLGCDRGGRVAGKVCGFGNGLRETCVTLEMGWTAGLCRETGAQLVCVYRDGWRREGVFTMECEKSVCLWM